MTLILKAWQIKKEARKYKNYYQCAATGGKIFYELKAETLFIYCSVTDNEPSLKIDWLTNLSAGEFRHNGNIFHYGFYRAAKSLFDYLTLTFNFLHVENIVIVGYSQGAAIAPILSILLSEQFQSVKIDCVSFEAPNYCKKACLKNANLEVVNVINGNDTVTKHPTYFTKYGDIVYIGAPRKWYKTGIVFRYDKTQSGMRKFVDIPEHQYRSVEENLFNMAVL